MSSPKQWTSPSLNFQEKLLPGTGLIGQVSTSGVHQKFTFPNDIDLLRDSCS
jgi:hypothetical protein